MNKIFYHRSDNILGEGQTLYSLPLNENQKFFCEEIGEYGFRAINMASTHCIEKLLSEKQIEIANIFSYCWELIFEWVRQKEYPNKVSRLSCLFAYSCDKDMEAWENCAKKGNWNLPENLYEVTSDESTRVDASWLDIGSTDWGIIVGRARKYWSGTINIINPLPEVLLKLPVTILRKIK